MVKGDIGGGKSDGFGSDVSLSVSGRIKVETKNTKKPGVLFMKGGEILGCTIKCAICV